MKLTFLGHACFLAEINGKKLLFDPFISPNELAKDIDLESLAVDYILVSHGHEDHVADVERIAKDTNAVIISNFEIVNWFANKGCEKGHPMNHGGVWEFDFGKVKMVNAVHSSVMPDGAYGGNPAGFIIDTPESVFYYAGDTALHMDMKLIPQQYNLDFAILPIGDNFTMGIPDAILASQFIECNNVIGMHYDTFGYIEIDHNYAKEEFKRNQIELTLLNIGQQIQL